MDWNQILYFKHVYGPSSHRWGVVGFPKSQPVATALRKYSRGQPVLLAVTKNPEIADREVPNPETYYGKIFAVCSFFVVATHETKKLANPTMVAKYPEVVARWDTAAPIDEIFSVAPLKDYDEFGKGRLADLGRTRRGQLLSLAGDPELMEEVRDWLTKCRRDQLTVDDSAYVAKFRRLFTQQNT
jgi:hypothetical protein